MNYWASHPRKINTKIFHYKWSQIWYFCFTYQSNIVSEDALLICFVFGLQLLTCSRPKSSLSFYLKLCQKLVSNIGKISKKNIWKCQYVHMTFTLDSRVSIKAFFKHFASIFQAFLGVFEAFFKHSKVS